MEAWRTVLPRLTALGWVDFDAGTGQYRAARQTAGGLSATGN